MIGSPACAAARSDAREEGRRDGGGEEAGAHRGATVAPESGRTARSAHADRHRPAVSPRLEQRRPSPVTQASSTPTRYERAGVHPRGRPRALGGPRPETRHADARAGAAWLDDYVAAWRSYDRDAIRALFAADASYAYHPYDEPLRGADAVAASWLGDHDEPGSWEAAYAPALIAGNAAIATGETRYTDGEVFSNLCELEFDDDGRCTRFVEWYWSTRRPDATRMLGGGIEPPSAGTKNRCLAIRPPPSGLRRPILRCSACPLPPC